MLFCTKQFLVFFTVVFTLYWAMPRRWLRVFLLLGALAALAYTAHHDFTSTPPVPPDKYPTWVRHATAAQWPAWQVRVAAHMDALEWGSSRALWLSGLIAAALALSFRTGSDRGRVWLLVGCSFYFYACWNYWLASLVFASTIMDYLVARGMEAAPRPSARRFLLLLSLVVNLGLLCYFKYANFFLHSLQEALRAGGATASLPVLSVILPVGISFYTFEAINYTVDVYRGKVPAERNLGHFLLFITFFPHLVAGPIVRARDFLPQIRRRKHWSWPRMQLGVQLFLMGLFKKLAVADRMAMFVDPVFHVDPATGAIDARAYGSYAVWVASIAYALQIYCDFSGYSDMALGTAHMLGYKLVRNFNMPYIARNVSEFWHRWHISLSTWLRDYLFIPLGGSRGGKWLTHRNLLITMTLGGLWHGANWTFVVWGVYHGLLLIGHRVFQRACKSRPRLDALLQSAPGTALCMAATFLSVLFGWVFFRAVSFTAAASVFHRLLVPHTGVGCPVHDSGLWYTVAVLALCHLAAASGWWERVSRRLPAPVLGVSYATVFSLVLLLNLDTGAAFIYFTF